MHAKGLVKKSARLFSKDTNSTQMVSRSCCSCVYLYLTSVYLICLWEALFFANLMVAWLSSHRTIGSFWGICVLCQLDGGLVVLSQDNRILLGNLKVIQKVPETHSFCGGLILNKFLATVMEVVMVTCFLEHHTMREKFKKKQRPIVLFLSSKCT